MQLNGISITWLGHATFLIEAPAGMQTLIDPWVASNPACPASHKKLSQLDAMLITHAHFDHIGDAVSLAKETGAKVVGMVETVSWLGKKGVGNLLPMNKGGTQNVDEISVTMTHALHSCGISDGEQILYGGEAAGYVVRFNNEMAIYHAGDTAVFSDMALIGELYHPDVALLPIGDHFTMGPLEATKAIELLKVPCVIPMHYGTFPLLTGTVEQLKKLTSHLHDLEIVVLEPGQRIS